MFHTAQSVVPTRNPNAGLTGDRLAGSVLLVDDDRIGLEMLKTMVEGLGFNVETAANGAEAYAMVREGENRFDLVITDRMMPVMDGLALTRKLKREPEYSDMPIVMLTGKTEAEDVAAGLEIGAFYYLLKPAEGALVASVLDSAMKEVGRKRSLRDKIGSHQSAFKNIEVLKMSLSKPSEIEPVCSLLASLHHAPEKIVQGVFELVQNGIEHGVLRFGFDAKHRLIAEGRWEEALADRANDPSFANAAVEATMLRRGNGLVLSVKDPGAGFNWRPYLSADPVRSSALCGRGIARANSFIFDKLVYNEAGNQATALMLLQKQPRW